MKKNNSVELKIIIALTAVMLALFTAVTFRAVFEENKEPLKFVYNYTVGEGVEKINNSDILSCT